MIVAIYDRDGALVLYLDAPEDQIALNVPEGGRFEEASVERMTALRDLPDQQEPPP